MKNGAFTAKVKIKLVCGCLTRSRSRPIYGARFGCTQGLGHGYRLAWLWSEEDGQVFYPKEQRGKGP